MPTGGGGLPLVAIEADEDVCDSGVGLRLFLSADTPGTGGGPGAGADGAEGGGPGGRGAVPLGGFGALDDREDSGSEAYAESLLAPVDIPPPVFLNFGMPPANMPPSWGGPELPPLSPFVLLWVSLLARARFVGVRGARPGTGGAPPIGGPAEDEPPEPPTIGAERSLVTAFFNFVPFEISPSSAPCTKSISKVVHGQP